MADSSHTNRGDDVSSLSVEALARRADTMFALSTPVVTRWRWRAAR
jgi:hypothetical protein